MTSGDFRHDSTWSLRQLPAISIFGRPVISPSLDFGLKFRYPGILEYTSVVLAPFQWYIPRNPQIFRGSSGCHWTNSKLPWGWASPLCGWIGFLEDPCSNSSWWMVWAVLCLPLWPAIRKRQNWAPRWRIGKSRGGEGLYYCEIRGWRVQQAGAGATTGALAEATRLNITGSFELFWTMLNMKIC